MTGATTSASGVPEPPPVWRGRSPSREPPRGIVSSVLWVTTRTTLNPPNASSVRLDATRTPTHPRFAPIAGRAPINPTKDPPCASNVLLAGAPECVARQCYRTVCARKAPTSPLLPYVSQVGTTVGALSAWRVSTAKLAADWRLGCRRFKRASRSTRTSTRFLKSSEATTRYLRSPRASFVVRRKRLVQGETLVLAAEADSF
mmetsp:Transcript_42132/g.90502  ORF Transcript_42132/g.90502 Transcript_42132/m.90502 type:complete len:202 (+) Transcript_42132:100-705(+)